MTEPLAVLEGVQKHFGSLRDLHDVDLTIHRGEVAVVINSGTISIDRVPHPVRNGHDFSFSLTCGNINPREARRFTKSQYRHSPHDAFESLA